MTEVLNSRQARLAMGQARHPVRKLKVCAGVKGFLTSTVQLRPGEWRVDAYHSDRGCAAVFAVKANTQMGASDAFRAYCDHPENDGMLRWNRTRISAAPCRAFQAPDDWPEYTASAYDESAPGYYDHTPADER
jgi:hypothetical protein